MVAPFGTLPVDFQHEGERPGDMQTLYGKLRNLLHEEAQLDQVREAKRIAVAQHDMAIGHIQSRIGVLSDEIKAIASDLLPQGSKHMDFPGLARIQLTDRAPAPKVTAADEVMQWAEAHERYELIEHKPVLLTAAVIKAAKAGEDIPGVEMSAGKRTMSVIWEGG